MPLRILPSFEFAPKQRPLFRQRRRVRSRVTAVPILGLALLTLLPGTNPTRAEGPAATPREIVFNRDIRPLLSAACFRCHGQDAQSRQADLRLDDRDSAAAMFASTDLATNPVWQRITSTDPETVMPPPEETRQLKDEEKELIALWIRQGAKYQGHWAF
jgi:uncharacterized membrane protein